MTDSTPAPDATPETEVVTYEVRGPVAVVTMNRPEYRNAQNSAMTYALDSAFVRAVEDPAVKVIVLAWVLAFMGVAPLAASFGGALGGELSSVLPMHAPAGVGTYPAAIAAGAVSFGAPAGRAGLELLATAGVNAHLLIIVSAVAGTLLSMVLGKRR